MNLPGPVAAGAALMVIATAAAFMFRASQIPSRAAIIIPLVDILAIGLFRAGTGGPGSVFTIMLVLPVISLGVEPGRLPLLLGGPVTIVAMLLPVAFDPINPDDDQWVVFVPLILGSDLSVGQ